MPYNRKEKSVPYWKLTLLFLLGIFFLKSALIGYKFNLEAPFPLTGEEVQYWLWSKKLEWGYYAKPPLIAWSLHWLNLLLGESEIVLKSLSNVCYVIGGWFVFLLGKHIQSPRTGFVAASIYITTPIFLKMSTQIRTDCLCVMFYAAALWLFEVAQQKQERKCWIALGLAVGLSALSKYAGLYFYLCAACYFFLNRSSWHTSKKYILLSLVTTLLVLATNVYGEWQNGFPAFNHTWSCNIAWVAKEPIINKWGRLLLYPITIIVLMGVINSYIIAQHFYQKKQHDRLKWLISFTLPIIILVSGPAYLHKLSKNWVALIFVPLSVWVALVAPSNRIIISSIAFNVLAFTIPYVAKTFYYQNKPSELSPYSVVKTYRNDLHTYLSTKKDISIVCDDYRLAQTLSYYLKDFGILNKTFQQRSDTTHLFHLNQQMDESPEYFLITSSTNTPIPDGYTVISDQFFPNHPTQYCVVVRHLKKIEAVKNPS